MRNVFLLCSQVNVGRYSIETNTPPYPIMTQVVKYRINFVIRCNVDISNLDFINKSGKYPLYGLGINIVLLYNIVSSYMMNNHEIHWYISCSSNNLPPPLFPPIFVIFITQEIEIIYLSFVVALAVLLKI